MENGAHIEVAHDMPTNANNALAPATLLTNQVDNMQIANMKWAAVHNFGKVRNGNGSLQRFHEKLSLEPDDPDGVTKKGSPIDADKLTSACIKRANEPARSAAPIVCSPESPDARL